MTLMAAPTGPQAYRGVYEGEAEEVTQARHDVSIILSTWRMESLIPPAQQVISELMANAVAHRHTAISKICVQKSVIMEMFRTPEGVRIAVLDHCLHTPVLKDATPTDEHGRGLALIEAFSSAWSWEPITRGRGGKIVGKRVWADITS